MGKFLTKAEGQLLEQRTVQNYDANNQSNQDWFGTEQMQQKGITTSFGYKLTGWVKQEKAFNAGLPDLRGMRH